MSTNRINERLGKAPHKRTGRRRKRKRMWVSGESGPKILDPKTRTPRSINSQGCEHLAQAKRAASEYGVTVSVKRIAGRASKDDGNHVQFRYRRFIVAEYWPTAGRLRIGGQDRIVQGILEAVETVGRTIENTESSAAQRCPRAG